MLVCINSGFLLGRACLLFVVGGGDSDGGWTPLFLAEHSTGSIFGVRCKVACNRIDSIIKETTEGRKGVLIR